ncbi:cytochrome c [Planococcus maritimus]|uniref:Cytochrome c n=1 Tax=Planococcus maritimus TaxID=192421 RepID=A0A150W861_PLAMR|nr:cytochrome c [Planococcus maritimus]ANU17677.1 cytochrome C-553 [Planococcus maritimus]KYG59195.1 cytochrome C-553 [Planococcus maritimus]OED32900.1 cytochrome C-553 [Planococcus maritimus]QMT16520.1 cytochrome c [Planococcus maritimus]
MKKQLMTVLFGSVLVLGACGGEEESSPEEPADTGGETETTTVDAEAVIQQNCISCHGENLEGGGSFPALNDVGSRLSQEEILSVIENGQGAMPPNIIEGEEAQAVAEYLANQK